MNFTARSDGKGPQWPFTAEMAARTIAAVAWPGEAREQRDEWAPKMLRDAELRDRTIEKARGYFDAAVRALPPIEDDLGGAA